VTGGSLLGVVATLAACAWRGVDRRPARIPAAADARLLVLASLTAVAAFAALGKVLSPQFLVWTIPLGVLALAWRVPLLAGAVAAATVLTQLEFPARYFDYVDRDPFPVALVSARNAVLLLAVWVAARTVLRQSSAASRICSIEVARPSSPAWIRTAFSQGSSSAVSKRTFV
jgi:hypothetical protein